MKALNNLQPEKVMRFFEEISDIPRESSKEAKIASYMENFARERGLECMRDASNNIIIRKPASKGYEDCSGMILQAHMDMVCVKEKGSDHDFDNEGLELYVEDGLIRARGTTLGADDGIGVAYGLAVLDSDDIKHPSLEVVFTTAEEIGMVGALALDMSHLKGKYMISFDAGGFTEGRIYVGCSGNIRMTAQQQLETEPLKKKQDGKAYEIALKGLKGGHAGGEIIKGRANGSVLLGRMLGRVLEIKDLSILKIQGGDKDNPIKNGIPDMFSMTVYTSFEKELKETAAEFLAEVENEFEVVEEGLVISVEETKETDIALTRKTAEDIEEVLWLLPNGVFSMNKRFKDTPECSSNVGNVEAEGNVLTYNFSVRSSKESVADFVLEKAQRIANLKGLKIAMGDRLPAWDYEPDSQMKDLVEAEYTRIYGRKPRFIVTPASTECSLFKRQIKGLDVISMGPIIYEEHTVKEYMEITSVDELWNFLKVILEKTILLSGKGF